MSWFKSPEPVEPRRPLTNEEEWDQWRSFVGIKHICDTCGALVGHPDLHAAWHEQTLSSEALAPLLKGLIERGRYNA